MRTILVLNNYSLNRVTKEVENNLKPAHHLFGVDSLKEAGYNLVIFDPVYKGFWHKLTKLLSKIPFCNLGDLGLQVKALRAYRKYDLVYAPCQDVTILLGVLSFFGLFRKPIIAVAHHPFLKGRLANMRKVSLFFSLKGHKFFPALSRKVALEINSITKSDHKSKVLHWGPDITYYEQQHHKSNTTNSPYEFDIVAIGRTGRDYQTLINGFLNSKVRVGIYCWKGIAHTFSHHVSANIILYLLDESESLTYKQIISICRKAKIIAIPMFKQDSLCGLTSVADAIALQMPILITKNEYIEIDIEGRGAGYWIEAYKPEEWLNKANKFLSDQKLFLTATHNSRELGSDYNSKIFGREIIQLVKQCI